MQLGMIGLGRMGANMVRRLRRDGHDLVVHDRDAEVVATLAEEGATPAASLAELVRAMQAPRAIWVMVPAGAVAGVMEDLAEHLADGDVVVDGGNSHYREAVDRAQRLAADGIHHLDVGVSGGVWGLDQGYCLMIGGEQDAVDRLEPVFRSLAPGVQAADRTPGRDGEPEAVEHGYLHCGPAGAGHFTKMVHNGIEYGVMAAYAEGLGILDRAGIGRQDRDQDAETTPLAAARYYGFDLDPAAITEVWRRGSVVRSWLLDLTAAALHEEPDLGSFSGHVSDSGEGRWTVQAAVDEGVPAPVISAALFQRFSSRGNAGFSDRVLSAMRNQFGGHEEKQR
jgi:6-phosphogluconate dehydrogenase